jgi:hypothetical protein
MRRHNTPYRGVRHKITDAIAGWIAENEARHYLFRERVGPMRLIEEAVSLSESWFMLGTRCIYLRVLDAEYLLWEGFSCVLLHSSSSLARCEPSPFARIGSIFAMRGLLSHFGF